MLEHGVPRTEYYSEAQLDLVEMGWKYGYDAGRAVEQALDKKAENARELGLDYEVEPKIGCVNHDCDQCKETQAEIERLNKALTWEQNRSERIGTHGPGCHLWGDRHYECLLREFNKENT